MIKLPPNQPMQEVPAGDTASLRQMPAQDERLSNAERFLDATLLAKKLGIDLSQAGKAGEGAMSLSVVFRAKDGTVAEFNLPLQPSADDAKLAATPLIGKYSVPTGADKPAPLTTAATPEGGETALPLSKFGQPPQPSALTDGGNQRPVSPSPMRAGDDTSLTTQVESDAPASDPTPGRTGSKLGTEPTTPAKPTDKTDKTDKTDPTASADGTDAAADDDEFYDASADDLEPTSPTTPTTRTNKTDPTAPADGTDAAADDVEFQDASADDLDFNSMEDAAAVLADNFKSLSGNGTEITTADLKKAARSSDPTVRAAAKYALENPGEWRAQAATDGKSGGASLEDLDALSQTKVDEEPALEYDSLEQASSVLADNFATISPDGKPIDTAKLKALQKSDDPTIAAAAKYMLENPDEWQQVSSTWGTGGVATASELRDVSNENIDNMDLEPAAHALNKNWDKLDPEGDGIDENTLRAALGDENASPELRAAAKYLLENPDEFSEIKNTMGDNGGNVTRANLEQYIANQSDADPMDPFTAASTLRSNWATISPEGKPLSQEQIKDLANNGKTPELREAARHLLNNPQDFQAADSALGQSGDGSISFGELGAAVDAGSDPMDPREAGLALKKHWAALDPEGKGLSKERMLELANDPKQPDDLQKALRSYLATPGAFDKLDTMSSPNPDQTIKLGDVELAASGFDPDNLKQGVALDTLMQQWDKFKGADGTLRIPADLQRVLDDPNSAPEVRVAAATILRDPEMQVDLENISLNGGAADGHLAFADVRALWEKANPDPNLENMSKAKMYEIAIANFAALAGDDGQIEQEDLRRIQRDPNASREVRAMADQLLNAAGDGAAGDVFRNLAMMDKRNGDNTKVTLDELKMGLEDETLPPMSVSQALGFVDQNFNQYANGENDWSAKTIDKKGLERMATDQAASPQARQAAKLLLANPEIFSEAETKNDGWGTWALGSSNDGRMSRDDLKEMMKDSDNKEFANKASAWSM